LNSVGGIRKLGDCAKSFGEKNVRIMLTTKTFFINITVLYNN